MKAGLSAGTCNQSKLYISTYFFYHAHSTGECPLCISEHQLLPFPAICIWQMFT